jgi:hypothetical protein
MNAGQRRRLLDAVFDELVVGEGAPGLTSAEGWLAPLLRRSDRSRGSSRSHVWAERGANPHGWHPPRPRWRRR